MKTESRYPGIKGTWLPGDTLLLVLTLVNITSTRTGNVIKGCSASGQNIWLKVELGTLKWWCVWVEGTESAVEPGPGLRSHLSDLQVCFENWLDAQECTRTGWCHTHYQAREEASNTSGGKVIAFRRKWDKFSCKGSTKYKESSLFTSSYTNGPISAFKVHWSFMFKVHLSNFVQTSEI